MSLTRILYVDDEEINLELLQLTFMNELEVMTATSAQGRAFRFWIGIRISKLLFQI